MHDTAVTSMESIITLGHGIVRTTNYGHRNISVFMELKLTVHKLAIKRVKEKLQNLQLI